MLSQRFVSGKHVFVNGHKNSSLLQLPAQESNECDNNANAWDILTTIILIG